MIVLSRLLSKSRLIFLGTDFTDYTDFFFEIITLFEHVSIKSV